MSPDYERRTIERPVQLRAAPEGQSGPGTLIGHGAVFNSRSRDLGGWFEIIKPDAFGAPDAEGRVDLDRHVRVLARTNHNSDLLLGTTDAGTLRLYIDDVGLRYEVDLPDTSYGRDLAVLAERGDIRFSSFAFRLLPDGYEWAYGDDDELIRHVTAASLVDVAPVADPAYWDATSELQRSVDLDAVRASLTTNVPGLPGERERAARIRAQSITEQLRRSR